MASSYYYQPGPQVQLHNPVSGPPTAVDYTTTPHIPYPTHPTDYSCPSGIPPPQLYPGTQYIAWHIKYYLCTAVFIILTCLQPFQSQHKQPLATINLQLFHSHTPNLAAVHNHILK